METRSANPFLSVVIPCYNEENNLERGRLDGVDDWLTVQEFTWEVIVVDDASTDNSRELIRRFIRDRERYVLADIPHGGKPFAVWEGIRISSGSIVLFMDMDQSTPIREAEELLPWFDRGFDVVVGSRGTGREGFSPLRKLGSRIFRRLRQAILLNDIEDTQCGFKMCTREAALDVFPRLQYLKRHRRPRGWKVSAFDVELLHLFERRGYRIKEVEVSWSHCDVSDTKCRDFELSRYVRESLEMAGEVISVKWNEMRGAYRDAERTGGNMKKTDKQLE